MQSVYSFRKKKEKKTGLSDLQSDGFCWNFRKGRLIIHGVDCAPCTYS